MRMTRVVAASSPISLSLIFFYTGTLLISLTTFRPVASFFNASDAFYLLAILLLTIKLLHAGENPLRLFTRDNPFFKPLLIFLLGATLSLTNSADLTTALIVIGKYVFLFGIWLPSGIRLLNTPQRINTMLFVLVAAALVPLIPGISDYYFHTRMTVVIDRVLNMNMEHPIPLEGRFGSVMGHPNNFGFLLVVVYPVALWLIFYHQDARCKWMGVVFYAALLFGCMVTASRSAIIAMAVQSVCFLAFMPHYRHRWKIAAFALLVVFSGTVLLITIKTQPVVILDRFIEMSGYNIGEYEPDLERIDYVKKALWDIRDHPLTGTGAEDAAVGPDIGVHNTVFRLWASIGLWGLIFAFWVYGQALFSGFLLIKQKLRAGERESASVAFLLLISIGGWILIDMVQPQFYDRFKFITLILLFSLAAQSRKAIASLPAPDRRQAGV